MLEIRNRLEKSEPKSTVPPCARLELPFELRQKSRLRATLDSGEEVAILLPRGEVLRGGDLLAASDGRVIEVVARAERLLHVEGDSPQATISKRPAKATGRRRFNSKSAGRILLVAVSWSLLAGRLQRVAFSESPSASRIKSVLKAESESNLQNRMDLNERAEVIQLRVCFVFFLLQTLRKLGAGLTRR